MTALFQTNNIEKVEQETKFFWTNFISRELIKKFELIIRIPTIEGEKARKQF